MATSRQVVEILDSVLALAGTGRLHAESLRAGGLLLSTQGRPEAIPADQIALLILSVLVGAPRAEGNAALIAEYAAMQPGAGGPTLIAMLTGFLADPHGLFELRVDTHSPAASITLRQPDNGMATICFASDWTHSRPAFDRLAVLDGGLFVRLAAAIRNAPTITKGRRRRNSRFSK